MSRAWWADSSGRVELHIELDDAHACSHSGDCGPDVDALLAKPYISDQLDAIEFEHITAALDEYGAWSAEELAVVEDSRARILWIACGDISDGHFMGVEG